MNEQMMGWKREMNKEMDKILQIWGLLVILSQCLGQSHPCESLLGSNCLFRQDV